MFQKRYSKSTAAILLPIAAAFLLALLFAGNAFLKTDGQTYLPLDDPYIFFAYARNAAHGNFFRYNAEDSPSLGVTSLLYYAVCSAGYLIGFRGSAIVWFSHLLGAAFLAASLIVALRFFQKQQFGAPFLAALLTLCFGKILWGFFCGMEIQLHAFLLLSAAIAFIEEKRKPLLWTLALLALTRPEGFLLAALICLYQFLENGRRDKVSNFLQVFAPVLIAALIYGLAFLYTGQFFGTAKQKISLFSADSGLGVLMMRTNENYSALLRFLWAYGTGFLALTPFIFLAMFHLRGREWILPALFFYGFFIEGFIAFGMWHHQRYFIPYLPLGMMMMVLGLERALEQKPPLLKIARAALALFFLWSIFYWADIYGDNCLDAKWANGRHIEFANENLKSPAILLVSDAGLFKYATNHYVLDYFGLGTPRLNAPNRMGGTGCVYEELRRFLAEEIPPDYKNRPVYSFAYWAFGGALMEKAASWEPAEFLEYAQPGDLVLMAGYDDGNLALDDKFTSALQELKLDWRAAIDDASSATLVVGYALIGGDFATTKIISLEKPDAASISLEIPAALSGGKFLRLSVRPTNTGWQPYIESAHDYLVRPTRPFQFVLWSPAAGKIRHLLSYRSKEEGAGVSEFPMAWVPFHDFFGFRHQLGDDKVFGFMMNPAVYDGSMNPDRPGAMADVPPNDRFTTSCLNIADLKSEAALDFRWRAMCKERQCMSMVERRYEPDGTFIWDGGRSITGECSFRFKGRAGQPLYILGRFGMVAPLRLRVLINGSQTENPWFLDAGDFKKWQYASCLIPADMITGDDRIALSVMPAEYPHLNIYRFWLFQPDGE